MSEPSPPYMPVKAALSVGAWAGTVALVVLALWLYGIEPDHPWREATIRLIVSLSALGLALLGGVRLGLAMSDESTQRRRTVLLGLLPAIAGLACLFVPTPTVFVLLALAFAAVGAWDGFGVHYETAPRWYGRLRTWTTVVTVAALVLAFVATA